MVLVFIVHGWQHGPARFQKEGAIYVCMCECKPADSLYTRSESFFHSAEPGRTSAIVACCCAGLWMPLSSYPSVRASRMIRDKVLPSVVSKLDNDELSFMLLLFRS